MAAATPSLPRIVTAFPDTVYDELAAAIKGQVFHPSETEYVCPCIAVF